MTLAEIIRKLELEIVSGHSLADLEKEVTGGYAGDMLSDVLANAVNGDLWITIQIHLNIIPIASMKDLAGIILANGRKPDEETLKKANEENVPVLSTAKKTFQIAGELYQLGIRGQEECER